MEKIDNAHFRETGENASGFQIIRVEKATSTNDLLAEWCRTREVDELTFLWANTQTAGKGQRGNSWESETGKNLTFSLVLYPRFIPAREQFILSMLISLSVRDALSLHTDGMCVKWPNDIYQKERKMCGILIENELQGTTIARCIAGIGINVNQAVFRSSAPNPVSLLQATGREHNRTRLLEEIAERISTGYHRLQANRNSASRELHARYMDCLFRGKGNHLFCDAAGPFTARIESMEPDGHLLLRDDQETLRRYAFKEVQYILGSVDERTTLKTV